MGREEAGIVEYGLKKLSEYFYVKSSLAFGLPETWFSPPCSAEGPAFGHCQRMARSAFAQRFGG